MKMNQEEREMKIIELLYKIESKLDKLDEIATLLHMGQLDSIQKTKSVLLDNSPLRKKVYELCDGKHTVSDIARSLGKSMPSISQVIARLLDTKIVTEQRKGKEKYYKRLF
jgi:DNA-binding transcriptional ArsR family regulator